MSPNSHKHQNMIAIVIRYDKKKIIQKHCLTPILKLEKVVDSLEKRVCFVVCIYSLDHQN